MTDQQEIRLGQMVGEYRLIRKLGGGGFGTVYLAEHLHEHTQVALKVLAMTLTEQEDLKDFINEASTIRLRHPHIVPLLNFGISRDDLPFLVMEYAPQGTLRDRYPKGTRLLLSTIVFYIDQLASGLQYAHDQRVIHRDVKPENILVRADGTLMVSDFGIAKLQEQSVFISRQRQVGTPIYMAPEQYRGYPCFASDQYALAVVAYEWICGVRPFQGTALALATQHMITPPPSLRNYVPALSEAIERVIFRALAKAPEDRFPCVQDFADALRETAQRLSGGTTLSSAEHLTLLASDQQPETFSSAIMNTESAVFSPVGEQVAIPITHPRWSRRKVLFTGTALIGGGLTWLAVSKLLPGYHTSSSAGKTLLTYTGHSGPVWSVTWSPDGKLLASASVDHTVQVWDASTGKPFLTYTGHSGPVNSVAWAPNGKLLASAGDDKIVQVWDASTGKSLRTYTGHLGSIRSVVWSPNSERIASASGDKTVKVWNATTEGSALFTYIGHSDWVRSVTWSPNGERLASAGDDKTVKVWHAAASGSPLFTYTGHSGGINSVAWSPLAGKWLASAGDDNTVQVWDANTGGKALLTYSSHSDWLRAVAWSPDGIWLASASNDQTVQVWNASTGKTLLTYTGHSKWVDSVAWSPNGRLIASAGGDKTVQVWEV